MTLLAASTLTNDAAAQQPDRTSSATQNANTSTGAVTIRVTRATDHLGTDVMSSDNRKVGDIVDYAFSTDQAPRLAYVLVMTGGFLGLGGDVRAVPAEALTLEGDTARIQLSNERYRALPVLPSDRVGFLADSSNSARLAREFGIRAPHDTGGERNGNQTSPAIVLFSRLRNAEAYSTEGRRLGYIFDAWINLDRNRAPYVEILPALPFGDIGDFGYVLPMTKLAGRGDYSRFTFNVSADKLSQAKTVSEAEGVQWLSSNQYGEEVLRVTLPRVAANSSGKSARRTAAAADPRNSASQGEPAGYNHNQREGRPASATGVADRVQIAPANAGDFSVRKFAGQHVRSSDDQDLGTLKDFIVDTSADRAAYAVVSSGGFAGIADKLHLVPITALRHGTGAGLTASIEKAQWNDTPMLNEESFEENRVAINDADQQKLARLFGGAGENATRSDSASTGLLLRASELRGKQIGSGEGDVGNIENVIVDLDHGAVQALVDPNDTFANSNRKFLVPLAKLQIATPEQDPITTSLTRGDFENASLAQLGSAEPAVTPTGRAGSGGYGPLTNKAQAVRRALDQDASLSRENVRVVPENDALVLRGSVKSQDIRDRIEDLAERAAGGTPISNKLEITKEQ